MPLSIGWIGLGTMGEPMASRLLNAGFSLTVWNRTASKMEPLVVRGARAATSPQDLAHAVEVTITTVSTPADVEAVCLGEHGVVPGLSAGKILIDMSTVDPSTSRKIAQAVEAKGAAFLDAPVSGSRQAAREGTLIFLVGGARATYERCLPLFNVLGKQTVYAGAVGMGMAMKLVINVILAHMMAALSEAAVLATRLGLNVEDLLEVVATGGLKSPWYQTKAKKVLARDFSVNFALKHMHKDIQLALALAHEAGVPLHVTDAVEWLFQQAAQRGKSELDYSSVITIVEEAAGVPARAVRGG